MALMSQYPILLPVAATQSYLVCASSDPEVLLDLARRIWQAASLQPQRRNACECSVHATNTRRAGVLGEILLSQGRHEDAVRVFNALTLMQPTGRQTLQNLGTSLRPTRRYAQALAASSARCSSLRHRQAAVHLGRCNGRFDYKRATSRCVTPWLLSRAMQGFRLTFAQCCTISDGARSLAAVEDWDKLEGLTIELPYIALLLVVAGAPHQRRRRYSGCWANPPHEGARSRWDLRSSLNAASPRRGACGHGAPRDP